MNHNYELIIYHGDHDRKFIKLGRPNVTIKNQGDQNDGFKRLGNQNCN